MSFKVLYSICWVIYNVVYIIYIILLSARITPPAILCTWFLTNQKTLRVHSAIDLQAMKLTTNKTAISCIRMHMSLPSYHQNSGLIIQAISSSSQTNIIKTRRIFLKSRCHTYIWQLKNLPLPYALRTKVVQKLPHTNIPSRTETRMFSISALTYLHGVQTTTYIYSTKINASSNPVNIRSTQIY